MIVNGRKYHLVSAVCSAHEYNTVITNDKFKTSQSGIKFFRVFCDGFVLNDESIHVFSKRPTTRVKSGKIFLSAKNENDREVLYHYCRLFNIPAIGLVYSFLAAFFWFLNKKHCGKNDVVFIDPLNVSIGYGAVCACKLRGIRTVMFLTDLPRYYCTNKSGHMSRQQRMSESLSCKADTYVFITEQMNDIINKKNKPYIVMEGFVDEGLNNTNITLEYKYTPFVCMYTGGLAKEYGLQMLVDGFLEADIPNSELHIYGAGEYAANLYEIAKTHMNVRYFGTRNNDEVVDAQMKATLLINPRYSTAEYTKYSFPGKNLEYAASGTPTLTTKLPGMPLEYYDYVYILKDETPHGMADALKQIASQSREVLYSFGHNTKEWMLKNKNCKTQIRKIIEFLSISEES